MDRCRRLLTSRFRCLGNLRLGPDSAEQIIKACVVLHNMCLDENFKGVSLKEIIDLKEYHCLDGPIEESDQFVPIDDLMYDSAIRMRERVVQDNFS
ncbi:hypothetical protein JTE90_009814 [Oedothorax gibbosus]|uniref:DDE Tnp4 domain-containing protein n=1 Tax=Oedothorax gibbosus TaxID=931172 RepID=A0AAV6TLH3_9ARAC|nr:hypothetical protein JTE90_009814 [Oedothorax gibbosus]